MPSSRLSWPASSSRPSPPSTRRRWIPTWTASPRAQREVLRSIAKGYTYKETADALGVSPRTVETHVSEVLRKLQLTNRNELTRWAVDRGLG